jgi:glycosyltransferase involved in cell wall biosynthesis
VTARFSIYHSGRLDLGGTVFGADVANRGLFQALLRHGGFEQLDLLGVDMASAEAMAADLAAGTTGATRLVPGEVANQALAASAGAMLRGRPHLTDLAWLRRRTVGDRAYSLLGLVHTIAPPTMRQFIANTMLAPIHPWDAIICTSPAVQQGVHEMYDRWGDYLGETFGGAKRPKPHLPLVPLGVDQAALAAQHARPGARAAMRAELGLGPDDILVIWIGRLSFFEKAFPQPMFRAVEMAARATGARVCFAMAGWFPGGEADRDRYAQAAKAYAPGVDIRFLDGGDPTQVASLRAGGDIFLSLVDNIQETFGLTPIEAMAVGLPVVASDWDGYRYTIRDGIDGFLVPTLGAPAGGAGHVLGVRQALDLETYQAYAGSVAQHTAVNVGRAGRQRVREMFDWPAVIGSFKALLADLAAIRAASPDPVRRPLLNPVRGDPFEEFAGFATQVLSLEMRLRVADGATAADLDRIQAVVLDQAFGVWRGTSDEAALAFSFLAEAGGATVREVLMQVPAPRRRSLEMSLVWMCKLGLLDWLD